MNEIQRIIPDIDNNVSAFLQVIRHCEGTESEKGWETLFAGKTFQDFSDHPNHMVTANGYRSTAAGAFQINYPTWHTLIQPNLHLPDFSKASQIEAAIFLLKVDRGYRPATRGQLGIAIERENTRWASLPGSPYGQPTHSIIECKKWFLGNGGTLYSVPIGKNPEHPISEKIQPKALKRLLRSFKTSYEQKIKSIVSSQHLPKVRKKFWQTTFGKALKTAGIVLQKGVNILSYKFPILKPILQLIPNIPTMAQSKQSKRSFSKKRGWGIATLIIGALLTAFGISGDVHFLANGLQTADIPAILGLISMIFSHWFHKSADEDHNREVEKQLSK